MMSSCVCLRRAATMARAVFASAFLLTGLIAMNANRSAAAPPQLRVSGDHLVNTSNATVRLKGVNIPSLEWSNGGENVINSVNVAIDTWKAKVIRLPISQDRWWSAAGNDGNAYRSIVDQVISIASSKNAYVIVDLHWSDMGQWGANIGQHFMPDDNTSTVWRDIAIRYRNNPAVLFDLYNEPHDVSWSIWRDGGTVSENGKNYHTPGIESLVYTVRNAGATSNVLLVGGLDWAYDLSGVVNWGPSGYRLWDPGSGQSNPPQNIVYSSHIYPWKANWDQYVTVAKNAGLPVFIGEFGTDASGDYNGWMNSILGWMDGKGYSATAWSMHTGASPCLIADWNYTPTYYFGTYTKNWLAR